MRSSVWKHWHIRIDKADSSNQKEATEARDGLRSKDAVSRCGWLDGLSCKRVNQRHRAKQPRLPPPTDRLTSASVVTKTRKPWITFFFWLVASQSWILSGHLCCLGASFNSQQRPLVRQPLSSSHELPSGRPLQTCIEIWQRCCVGRGGHHVVFALPQGVSEVSCLQQYSGPASRGPIFNRF
jgi:hypothetical protein